MRILFSPNENIINSNQTKDWCVDEIVLPSKLSDFNLPDVDDGLIMFVPTIINQDFAIEYDGAEYALKVYFDCLRKKKLNIKIVLLGIESLQSFMLKFAYPKILQCPGFEYLLFNISEVTAYSKDPDIIDYDSSIDSIKSLGISLPESYKSNHSFINEWSVYKWSEFMGYDNSTLLKAMKDNIYFDFLSTILGTKKERVSSKILTEISNLEGKVLLIDDSPYWHSFFTQFFKDSKVQLKTLGLEFKKQQANNIVELCKKQVDESDPDVILLDFRLNEDKDFDVKNRKEISGIKVLRNLKGTLDDEHKYESPCKYFGSKIIMFTATGKIDHVFAMQDFGADAFILKERPENYIGKSSTKKVIGDIQFIIKEMMDCALVSKPVNVYLDHWLTYSSNPNVDDSLSTKLKHVVEVVRPIMIGNFLTYSKLKLIYLECFSILDSLKTSTEKIKDYIDKLASELGLVSDKFVLWDNLDKLRNSLAHGDAIVEFKKNQKTIITKELISEWLVNLCDFIDSLIELLIKNQS